MMVGFDGPELSEDVIRLIREYKIGNIILFSWNITSKGQMMDLCRQIQELVLKETGLPAFIAIDQEGGAVSRLPSDATRIPGAMALAGANIVAAQIFTMSNGMALDTFLIQETLPSVSSAGSAFDKPERLAKLATLIEQALSGRLKLRDALAKRPRIQSRARVFAVPPRVLIDNKASATHTVIEVNGRDRSGLLFEVTNALTELGLSIGTAKIATYGERVVDVFYVKDVFGHKIDEEHKLKRIRERLLAVLADPDAKDKSDIPVLPRRLARTTAVAG